MHIYIKLSAGSREQKEKEKNMLAPVGVTKDVCQPCGTPIFCPGWYQDGSLSPGLKIAISSPGNIAVVVYPGLEGGYQPGLISIYPVVMVLHESGHPLGSTPRVVPTRHSSMVEPILQVGK